MHTIQSDHVHFLIRSTRRAQLQNFFRVVSGQIAQQFQKQGLLSMRDVSVTDTPGALKLWKYRPFTRVVRGWKAYNVVRNYVRLNEQEALGNIPYRKERLKGLSAGVAGFMGLNTVELLNSLVSIAGKEVAILRHE